MIIYFCIMFTVYTIVSVIHMIDNLTHQKRMEESNKSLNKMVINFTETLNKNNDRYNNTFKVIYERLDYLRKELEEKYEKT